MPQKNLWCYVRSHISTQMGESWRCHTLNIRPKNIWCLKSNTVFTLHLHRLYTFLSGYDAKQFQSGQKRSSTKCKSYISSFTMIFGSALFNWKVILVYALCILQYFPIRLPSNIITKMVEQADEYSLYQVLYHVHTNISLPFLPKFSRNL